MIACVSIHIFSAGERRDIAIARLTKTTQPVGELAAVRQQLQAIEPRLQGVAAQSAREALAVLDAHPAPEASAEIGRAWAARLMDALNELVRRAPESETVLDLAERAQRAVGRA